MPLRARLTAAFLVVVLGPVLLGAVFIGAAVNAVTDGRAVDRLNAAAASVTAVTRNHCDRLTSTAAAIAVLFGEDTAAATAAASHAVTSQRLERVWLSDTDGAVVAEAGVEAAELGNQVQCRQPTSVTGIDTLVAGVEVQDADGRRVGYATAAMRVDAAFLAELAEVSGAEVTVDDGRMPPSSSYTGARSSQARESLRLAESSAESELVVTGDTGLMVRSVPVETGSPVPYVVSLYEDSGRELFGILAVIVVTAALLAVSAAAWLARSATRPMAQLADGAEAIARGDLTVRVPVHGNDELAGLARSFNRMARETQGYVQALTASRDQLRGQLNLLGDTLSSTLDLERILEVIVDTAVVATGARAGVMLLVDADNSQMLAGRIAEGPAEVGTRRTGDIRLPIGEGLLGEVAARTRAIRGTVGGEGMPILSPREPQCRSFLAVPVVSLAGRGGDGVEPAATASGLLGVLAVYDRPGDDEFDDTDLTTLRTFAGQAAVAVGNVLSHREAQRLSLTDPLTGLWNYRYLQVSMAREVERAGRFHRRAAVIVIDLDKFKVVNDTFGHLAGDTVLAEVARRISNEIRDVDLAFRYGGEEFVVLLPEAEVSGAERVAERLWQAVRSEPVSVESAAGQPERVIDVTVSLGVAVFPDHGDDGSQVLSAADEALYAAKAAGRDTWRVAGR
ncbi:diguanylate cyclase (GGDEF)-like protein [Stackebrandtia endophytica]|uniref:Diguanylate cyclase (GGDEF)-like protein n=1 Tax=Stackebrandtia endophytica TaxID=1496996 RepID=A0A543AYT6_9ACTN|nr:diguanylate cyclase [Stackebrandtia endophytica]TQL77742.1 diguanylate cyclase (GGDEF)-like protein [Stackebrandtia endophytica]